MSNFQNDSIFWIEVGKIKPNPFQPRKEFSEDKLNYLAESIRQYGVLQPLVVTRQEIEKPDGGLVAEYELIAGERRLRASKIAGLSQVPVIIRTETEDQGVKLELAIIENLQREDLNPIDRALAFQRLIDEFGLKHTEIGKKMGKSREYVSNSVRLLSLPEEIRNAISATQITEGHARPLMMLRDRPEEQLTLFKEIIYKKLTVRDAEAIAKKVAYDKVRRKVLPPDPEMMELEGQLAESLGTRVQIERKEVGGKLTIDFFTNEDLKNILDLVHTNDKKSPTEMLDNYIQSNNITQDLPPNKPTSDIIEHPHSSVEKEIINRPMTEITDTATDEIDKETQIEIKDEAEIVGRTSDTIQNDTETSLVEDVEKKDIPLVEVENNFSTEVIPKDDVENVNDSSLLNIPPEPQSEFVDKSQVSYMNVGKEFKMSEGLKEEKITPLDKGVEIINQNDNLEEDSPVVGVVNNQNLQSQQPTQQTQPTRQTQLTQPTSLVQSTSSIEDPSVNKVEISEKKEVKEDDDLYSVKNFSL